MATIVEEEIDEKDRGPLVYQESKVFNSECYLCNVYDNTKKKYITFQIFGLDTQDMLQLTWEYNTFDALFRFNAELMNPNRKEGRFHWVIERLGTGMVGKDRKLQLKPEPSEEAPLLPFYEQQRKIPTGRMNLKERQRLREQMDMLEVKRSENIAKKRNASKKKFLDHIFFLKEQDKAKKDAVEAKIAAERSHRFGLKEEMEKAEALQQVKIEQAASVRNNAVEVKEARTEEQDEEEYRLLRQRWKELDARKAETIREAHEHKEKELEERRKAAEKRANALEEVQKNREENWTSRASRITHKQDAKIEEILEVKRERERIDKVKAEAHLTFIKDQHDERQPIFEAQAQRTLERTEMQEAEAEAKESWMQGRALPKKVKTKGTSAARQDDEPGKASKAKSKSPKKTKKSDKDSAGEDAEQDKKAAGEKALMSVESKMRAEMEEQQKREELEEQRQAKIELKDTIRQEKEVDHMKTYREDWRQTEFQLERQAKERQLTMADRGVEGEKAKDRKSEELERLRRIRALNIARREQNRLAAAEAPLSPRGAAPPKPTVAAESEAEPAAEAAPTAEAAPAAGADPAAGE
jgi:hypothetical protein